MKILKSLFILFIAISFTNCSSNDVAPSYPLSLANIAGTYNINSLSVNTDINTTSNDIKIKVATASIVGDLFKVDLILNSNGTYTMKGNYTINYKLVPVVGNIVEERDIITVDNSGTFTLDTANNFISFSNDLIKDLGGILKIVAFNETSFALYQEIDIPVSSNIEEVTTSVAFERK